MDSKLAMENTLISDLVRLIAVFLLVLANGFFVAAEFALVSVRQTRIAELITQGNRTAKWVKKAIDDPDRFIAATQLGITLASLALGWIGEPALGHLLQPIINIFPVRIEEELSHSLSAGFAFAIITFLHVVVGELAPKSIALQNPERTSLFVAQPTVWTEWIFKPAIWALNGTGNYLLRVLGIQPASAHELVHSPEELKMLASASAESGIVKDTEEELIHAVFEFGDMLVRHVMVPRTEMVAIPIEATIDELIGVATQNPFTKFPVYENSLDHVVGIVHLKDLIRVREQDQGNSTAKDLMRDAIFIPETAKLDDLLNRFRARKRHIAIVLDEYGGTAGIVTLEDLLEEIVGEVSDPFDTEPEIQPLPDGSSSIDGLTLIDEVNEHFNLNLLDPYYDTIAGYILGRIGRLAQVGDVVLTDGVELRVIAMDGLRIARVSLSRLEIVDSTPTDEEVDD
jgi:CBS domain containing-hemolysin-like protein